MDRYGNMTTFVTADTYVYDSQLHVSDFYLTY